jgi:hypothetical protein
MGKWRDRYEAEEQAWMVLKDQYSEVARALGFEGDAWFGDPLACHDEIVARAKELARYREPEQAVDTARRLAAA